MEYERIIEEQIKRLHEMLEELGDEKCNCLECES